MGTLLQHFDFSNIYSVVAWIVVVYGMVLGSMVIDLACGIYKAMKAGIATTSTGLKKTCTKASQYFLPMICLSCADIMASAFIEVPPFTMLYGAFCVICEFKSIFENTHTKVEIKEAAETMNIVLKNKEDLAKVLIDVMKEMQKEK